MDTQNNAKGGYGYGGDANNKADPLKYMAGSQLSTMWTSQHSCGSENNECQIVVQYMCNPAAATPDGVPGNGNGAGEGPVRDGTDNGTPDPNNPDATTGLHEPASFYAACDARERNKGLYTADQNMNNNNGARATRQNPNGNRSGQECPEERDYYPYWHPSPWKDVAILTNNLRLCDWYQQNSQNVVGKNYCQGNDASNNAQDCAANGGTWATQPAWGIAPPECVLAPFQRDNHLGNGPANTEITYNWTIPYAAGATGGDDATNCVARFRYNITTSDTKVCSLGPGQTTQAACEAAGGIWSAAYLDANYNNDLDGNNNAANGNQDPPLLEQNPDIDMGGFLNDGGGTESMLELAVNTNQYGRTFQDRTHVFSIQSRPVAVAASTTILNLNVKGKRGNIVQTYPATEYDFTPTNLCVNPNDMVHVQWSGNDNTNNNGNNNGEGTDDEDRHNMVQLSGLDKDVPQAYASQSMFDLEWEWNPEATGSTFGGARDQEELTKQAALSKQTNCATEGQINNDQQRNNCQKLNSADATVDLGLMKFKAGNYKYMSSRNMNFSNRAQKASMNVGTTCGAPGAPVAVEVQAVATDNENVAALSVTWASPGSGNGAMSIDGNTYWGYDQVGVDVVDYAVSYSLDGGASWVRAGGACSGVTTGCTIDGVPAGTTALVMVQAGSSSGWGTESEVQSVMTPHSASSESCASMLSAQAEGTYTSPGTIVAICFGVIAIILIIAAVVFFAKRRQPPPSPGGFGKGSPPAYLAA